MTNHKIIYNKWEDYFSNRGLEKNLLDSYLVYIDGLLTNNLPIIFESEHLSLLLGRNEVYLNSVVFSTELHYRDFKLRKRKGGFRIISVPYPALLECQKWIHKNILSKVKISPYAHGFAKKKSIVTNARKHTNQEHLLKIDLKDFFPSIKKGRVIAMFCKLGYSTEVSFYLASICCKMDCLPQGAPTSPSISNIIAKSLDNRLFALSQKFEIRYTRYADDLAFSGGNIPARFIDYVTEIVTTESFEINNSKTQLHKSKGKRIITGVAVNGEIVKAPKSYKRKLFQTLYYIEIFGLNSHRTKLKIRNPNYLESLIGKLNYVLTIEPDNSKAKNYLTMLIEIDKSRTHNSVYK
ncbi:reverse transcriptase family protein [Flagellimonas sp. S3867]|uniref:reverse transcriptase family protein n=1 Tax=Flagellimonas sp. S3867 TaxID=2768063 RepID=UPI0016894416|nr:reverse transcriptase family protein [Flagellimonas sp. S3867]